MNRAFWSALLRVPCSDTFKWDFEVKAGRRANERQSQPNRKGFNVEIAVKSVKRISMHVRTHF
jgi:hypothetical protein